MKLEDRINELSFHKNFSQQDFYTDCKVFGVWKDVFKKKPKIYDFIVTYYFDLQKRAAKKEISMKQVQKRLFATIVTSFDRDTATSVPKIIIRHLGVRKAMQVMNVLRKMGWKK